MTMTKITLWGWYQYKPDLFDDAPFPASGNKQVFIDLLMERSGMLYTYHQQPDYLKKNITNWFNRKEDGFNRMFAALKEEYNPIHNYDRHEDYTDTPNITYSKSGGHTNNIRNESIVGSENKVSAFNSNSYEPNTQTSGSDSGESTETFKYQSEQEIETGTRTHSGHMYGNIGVTTNQQMLEAELNLRTYDIYETIAKQFESDFLCQVY